MHFKENRNQDVKKKRTLAEFSFFILLVVVWPATLRELVPFVVMVVLVWSRKFLRVKPITSKITDILALCHGLTA